MSGGFCSGAVFAVKAILEAEFCNDACVEVLQGDLIIYRGCCIHKLTKRNRSNTIPLKALSSEQRKE